MAHDYKQYSELRAEDRVHEFMNWYNKEHQTAYSATRTEKDERFRDLVGQLRWDFVAAQPGNKEWIAVEVKRLVAVRSLDAQYNFWQAVYRGVTGHMQGKIAGEFLLIPPSVKMKQKQRQALIETLANIVIQIAPHLEPAGQSQDVGPELARLLPHWPNTKSNNFAEYDCWGEYRPAELLIFKSSEEGCAVQGGSPVVEEDGMGSALEQAIQEALDKGKTSEKLGIAKCHGAVATMLLLDWDITEDPITIEKELQKVCPQYLLDLDYIYLLTPRKISKVRVA